MKKLLLILVLGVSFGSSGFGTASSSLIMSVDCDTLQHNVYAAYYNAGYSSDEAWDESVAAYERCTSRNTLRKV